MSEILEHRRMVDALQATIDEQKHALDALERALAARDQAAKALQISLEDQRTRTAHLETVISTHEQTIADLRGQLDAQHSLTESLRTELAQTVEAQTSTESTTSYKLSLALTLANAAYDALLVLDENQQVTAINTSAETLFECEGPIGDTLASVTGSPELEMIVHDALANQEASFEDQVIINKRTYRARAQVIPRDGHTFIGLALQDITELVRLNRARRDMVANISHELRTPIANIRLTIDSIFHEQDKPKGKASRNALKAIARETDSLLWLVQELLDLSMIESGHAILRMVDVPADLLVNEAIERMLDQSEAKDLVITGVVPEEDIQVLCDRDQARRVLINLIHNAIKWSPDDETIRVEVRDGSDEVTFAVLDNGPGVPEEHTERIFERFYQVDPARSKGGGSGLGLAICKHIVEAHGGRIWAEANTNGGGGRFLFTLPKSDGRVSGADSSEFA